MISKSLMKEFSLILSFLFFHLFKDMKMNCIS